MLRRRITVTLAAVAAALTVAGCGAGQITQTDTQLAAVNGEQGEVGSIQISNAVLVYPPDGQRYWPAGADVPLSMSIANNGPEGDELQSASTRFAQEVQIKGDQVLPPHRALTVGGAPAESFGAEEQAAADEGEVGNATMVLKGLKQNLFPGQVVFLTLTFADAGSVKLRLPIAAPAEPRAEQPENEHQGSHG